MAKGLLFAVVFLLIICYCSNVKQCDTDSNCAAIWDDVSGLPY